MSERVLLFSTWYPSHQEDRGWNRSWAIADIVAELQRHSVSTVAVAARTDQRKVATGYVHGQLVISVPYCLLVSDRLVRKKIGRAWRLFRGKESSGLDEMCQTAEPVDGALESGGASQAAFSASRAPARIPAPLRLGTHQMAQRWEILIRMARSGLRHMERPFQFAKLQRVLSRLGRFDRVIIHGRVAQHMDLVQRLWAGPVSVCFHETDYHEPETADVFRTWGGRIERVAFRSRRLRERFVRRGLIDPLVPYFLVLSGVPEKTVRPRKEYSVRTPGLLKLVCVASMIPRKNLGMLIETLSVIQAFDWTLDLYGDGPLRKQLESQVEAMGLDGRIRFHGFVAHDEVMRRYSAYDVFVLLSERETFGLVYTEALSQGLFVIATEGEGIDGLIEDGVNGFLVPLKRPDVLLEKLQLISDLDSITEAGFKDRIYESIRALTLERIAGQYHRFMVRGGDPSDDRSVG